MNAPTIICDLGSEQRVFQQQAGGSGGRTGKVPGACEVSVTEGNEVIAHCHSSLWHWENHFISLLLFIGRQKDFLVYEAKIF